MVAIEEKTNPTTYDFWKEIRITKSTLLFTFLCVTMASIELGDILYQMIASARWGAVSAHIVFCIIVFFLLYGGILYQFCRLGYLKRRRQHQSVSEEEMEPLFKNSAPSLSILIPSYKEEERVVFLTLMSAALQDYPLKRVVLLIDDPPFPQSSVDRFALTKTRQIPGKVQKILAQPRQRFSLLQAQFHERLQQGSFNLKEETGALRDLFREGASWFVSLAEGHAIIDHSDSLFVEKVLRRQADSLIRQSIGLEKKIEKLSGGPKDKVEKEILQGYFRLVSLFSAEITSFERKLYENCSHESNKAMNLNSYIDLIGKSFNVKKEGERLFLEEALEGVSSLQFPDSDYFITLDADSIILPEYALRLIHLLEQPENSKVAVAQTPYSAFPNSPGLLERIAGATTDIQYLIHQGFTHHNATYWVGANALLRKSALVDIGQEVEERGYKVMRYIHDRTVIEDTESSIDLIHKGWTLFNYPERLAYSATPPDFGSLLIQRRRWANGGLIILPKLISYLSKSQNPLGKIGEGIIRCHYLISIAAVNIGLLAVIAFPFTENVRSAWLPLCALPYLFLYRRDMISMGYCKSDFFRVYALNLLLIPVNMGGVLKSIQQAWTKQKIPFGRTPKVSGRTAVPPVYILMVYFLVTYWTIRSGWDIFDGHLAHGCFALANAVLLAYAIWRFIGLKSSLEDLGLSDSQTSCPKTGTGLEIEPAQTEFLDISESEMRKKTG